MERRRDPSTKDEDLAVIKEWLKKQPHLPNRLEDAWLVSFLRGCNFSLEKCKRKLDMYFSMKNACPELLANKDILRPELMEIMTITRECTMPDLTPEGWRVSISKGYDKTAPTERLLDALKVHFMLTDLRMRDETDDVAGDVYILDADVVQSHHLRTLSVTMVKKIFVCINEVYPIRIKAVHVVNTNALIDTVFSIVKPFLKEKIKQRIFFHKDYATMQEHLPKKMIPEDYGGTGPSLKEMNNFWLDKLKEHRDWFLEQELLKSNEALRPGKPKDYDELFGIEGSFRQLTID